MEKKEYLVSVVGELLVDAEWEVPADMRFFLVADLEWTLFCL